MGKTKINSCQEFRRFKSFLERFDVEHHALWHKTFGYTPPWTEVERLAHITKAKIRAHPWQWNSKEAYETEIHRLQDWFTAVVPGTRRHRGLLRDHELSEGGGPHPVVSEGVADLLRRCLRPVYLEGCMHWASVAHWLRCAGIEPANGTTDVETGNAEIISALRAGKVSRLSKEAFALHADLLFLRVAARRSRAGAVLKFLGPQMKCC